MSATRFRSVMTAISAYRCPRGSQSTLTRSIAQGTSSPAPLRAKQGRHRTNMGARLVLAREQLESKRQAEPGDPHRHRSGRRASGVALRVEADRPALALRDQRPDRRQVVARRIDPRPQSGRRERALHAVVEGGVKGPIDEQERRVRQLGGCDLTLAGKRMLEPQQRCVEVIVEHARRHDPPPPTPPPLPPPPPPPSRLSGGGAW